MAFPIGFTAERPPEEPAQRAVSQPPAARPSVVQVHFDKRNMTLAYYNDRFDLHPGDLVYVDGKLEGLRGRVMEVNYNFKIRISDYKRVIAVADTQIHGTFYMAGTYFVTYHVSAVLEAAGYLQITPFYNGAAFLEYGVYDRVSSASVSVSGSAAFIAVVPAQTVLTLNCNSSAAVRDGAMTMVILGLHTEESGA